MKPLPDWEHTIEERMPLFGHRNWLVVADAAYPAQSRPGIETILSGESQKATLETLLAHLRTCRHVRPIVYVDRELEFVDEKDAPGVGSYLQWLQTTLKGLTVNYTPHEEIIAKLDRAAQMFSILIIKSTMAIPYTSVFIELDCGYWDADSEARLRADLQCGESKP
jgi:hypothetical protein